MIALASAEIKEGEETAPKLSVRGMAELIGMSKTMVQIACDQLKLDELPDDEKRLTPKGLDVAMALEAQAREIRQDSERDR